MKIRDAGIKNCFVDTCIIILNIAGIENSFKHFYFSSYKQFKFAPRTRIRRSKIDENYFSCKFHQNLTFLSLSLFRFCEEDEKDPRLPIEEITSSNLIPSPPFPSLRSPVIILLYHAKWKVNQHSSLLDLSSISTVLISNR